MLEDKDTFAKNTEEMPKGQLNGWVRNVNATDAKSDKLMSQIAVKYMPEPEVVL